MYEIHTDGSCLNNPGPGGYAAIIIHQGQETVLKGAEPQTTNNRMEMSAAIAAVQHLPAGAAATLHSDSKILTDAFNQGWVKNWQKNGWKTARKQPVENQDLWLTLLGAMQGKTITYRWVKGHAGDHYNERCDRIANEQAKLISKNGPATAAAPEPTPVTAAAPTQDLQDQALTQVDPTPDPDPVNRHDQLAANLRDLFSQELVTNPTPDGNLTVQLPILDANHRPITLLVIPDDQGQESHVITDQGQSFNNNSVLPQEILDSASWQKMLTHVTTSHGVNIEPDQTLTFQALFDRELAKAVFQMAQALTAIETLRNTALLCRNAFQ